MRGTSSPIPLIAQREMRQRLRSKAFFVFTALIAIAIIGIALLNRALSNDGPTSATVVVSGQAPPGLDATLRAAGDARNLRVTVVTAPDRSAAVADLDGGTADAAVVVPASGQGELLFRRRVDSDLEATVASAWQVSRGAEQASQLGVQPGEIGQILNPTPLHTVTIEPESAHKGIAQLVGTLAAILLFISVSTFGGLRAHRRGRGEDDLRRRDPPGPGARPPAAGRQGAGDRHGRARAVRHRRRRQPRRAPHLGRQHPVRGLGRRPLDHRLVHRRLRALQHPVRPRRVVRLPPGGCAGRGRTDLDALPRRVPGGVLGLGRSRSARSPRSCRSSRSSRRC